MPAIELPFAMPTRDHVLIAPGGSHSVAVNDDWWLPLRAVSSTTAIHEPSARLTHASWRPGIS